MSPSPICVQIFAVASGMTGWASAVTIRKASPMYREPSRAAPGSLRLFSRPGPTVRFRQYICRRRRPVPRRFRARARTGTDRTGRRIPDRLSRSFRNRIVAGSFRRSMRGIRHLSLEVPRNHGQRAAGEIAESVSQIGVVALHQRVERERSILPEHDFAQQEIPQSIGAEHVKNRLGAHDVAARLRHLALFKQQPAVRNDRLGHRQAGGEQKCRPVHAMEAHDFFADHVHIGGPVFLEPLARRRATNRSRSR